MTYLTIKNIRLDPERVDNDGGGTPRLSCMVFTNIDNATVHSVSLDLKLLGAAKKDLDLDPRESLPSSREGRYATTFEVPQLTDPGLYELPILARDSDGRTHRVKASLSVAYRRPGYTDSLLAPANQEVLARVGGSPILAGNRVVVMADGETAMRARLELLAAAKRQVDLQTYLFNTEGIGEVFYEALISRLGQGVRANIILNGDTQIPAALWSTLRLTFHRVLGEISEFLEEHGLLDGKGENSAIQARLNEWKKSVNLILFSGALLRERGLMPQRSGETPGVWLQKIIADANANRRSVNPDLLEDWSKNLYQGPGGLPAIPLLDHAIHEKMLIADGEQAIVGGRNLSDEYFSRWLDTDLLLAGPIVGEVQKGFFRNYRELSAEGGQPIAEPAPASPGPAGETRAQFVQSRPWAGEHHTLHSLVTAFQMARRRISAYSQYLILPDSLLLDSLLDAARRGVDVRILTNSLTTGQVVHLGTGYFISLNYFARLLDAGIRVFLLRGDPGLKDRQPYLHVKEFIVDGELAVFGSFNLSMRSCYIESENLVNVFDPELAAREEAVFDRRLADEADEATPAFLQEQYQQYRNRIEIVRNLELLF